ncbi:hypothetical protein SSX86_030244 [Deinandra increscens subsp. villosa]|uniref:RRM domain-containing protein n=1 Tax=Deinandra increscens subsp. villosa TaxID=3103831 RepID=A0AAP0GJE6_9ASTR
MENRRKPIPEAIQRRITKIFVTNLPEGCSGADLASNVRVFGQIFDLYIARKRDKGGNRFGFISMLDVKDCSELLKSLRNIRLGNNKLWFNVARFVLEDGEVNMQRDEPTVKKAGNAMPKDGMTQQGSKFDSGEMTFKDMLVGKTISIDDKVNGLSGLHERAIVGRMIDVEAMKRIYLFLHEICPGFGTVQYLGGLDLLISFDDPDMAALVFEAAKSDTTWFSSVCLWKGQSLSFERLAWLKVKGIPLHLFTNEVLNLVGGMFGRVVYKASKLESDPDLSFDYVGILVGDGKKLSEEVILEWKSRKFRVWINEELGDWIPEFYPVLPNVNQETNVVHVDDNQETNVDLNVEESNEKDVDEETPSPEVVPESMSGEINNCNGNEEFLERNDEDINAGINCQSTPILEEVISEFVPAINFNFEQSILKDSITGSNTKVVKRKKCKKSEMGRPSNTYTSSNESQRIGKKPKKKNIDLFGLNGLLGISDHDLSSDEECSDDDQVNSLGLNLNPSDFDKPVQRTPTEAPSTHHEVLNDSTVGELEARVNFLQQQEAEATKAMGVKLGVNLEQQHNLILESIIVEGLQKGNK